MPDYWLDAAAGDEPADLTDLKATHRPRIDIVHVRDPDSESTIQVFVDGVETTDYRMFSLDIGASGPSAAEWAERQAEAVARASDRPAVAAAVDAAYEAYADSSWLSEEDDDF